jgi:hypothetical protein
MLAIGAASLMLADQIDRPCESVPASVRLSARGGRPGRSKRQVQGVLTARAKAADVLAIEHRRARHATRSQRTLGSASPPCAASWQSHGRWARSQRRLHPGCIVVGRLVPISELLEGILRQIRMHRAALIHYAAMVSSKFRSRGAADRSDCQPPLLRLTRDHRHIIRVVTVRWPHCASAREFQQHAELLAR